jgi:hypothetical protein
MVYFQTKNPILGKFLDGLRMENVGLFCRHLEYFTYGHLIYFMVIFFTVFGILCQEKSGNPATE